MTMISTAASGLSATQVVLNTISNNVANSETDGYSRRTVVLTSQASGGVSASSLERQTSFFLQQQTWGSTSEVGYYTSYSDYSSYLEQLMSSDSLDITSSLSAFYSALESASSSPDDEALRTAVLTAAQTLATTFNALSGYLDDIAQDVNSQIDSTVTQVNDLSAQIADLNQQIVSLQSQGLDTSALEDSRDAAIDSLSELVEFDVLAQADGSYSLTLPQGQTLVSGSNAATLSWDSSSGLSLTFGKQTTSISEEMSGSLGGLFAFVNEVLEPTQSQLDSIAVAVAEALNDAQADGYDLDGDSGAALFSWDSQDPAGTLSVSSGFTTDDLAFAGSSTTGSGDNDNLLAMLELSEDQQSDYTALVTWLGQVSSQASNALSTSTTLQSSLSDSLDSISGVNLDEEAANLVVYQNIYSANAKVLSAADELFDTVLNMF
ncbi:flagellar hook-associated protein FlgK [Pseudaeromonas sp. ZJS20]|uniref:flagellar hook-associated protein FlgK n=1 Tax=Pseudaeromonas aegiceratis TaxID=3153928 RepID=UPI00390C7C8A